MKRVPQGSGNTSAKAFGGGTARCVLGVAVVGIVTWKEAGAELQPSKC
jgi:hypothetical protein